MKDTLEIKGYWWLPDDPDNQLPGTLTYSQEDGARLEIVGVFGRGRDPQIAEPIIILGFTQQGKAITLYKCLYTKATLPLMGLGGASYYAHFIFEGVHFESEEEIKFHELRGNYTNLDAWVDIYGFTIENKSADGGYISEIRYEQPESRAFDINDEYKVGIVFSCQGPIQSVVQTEARISQRAHLTIRSKIGDICFSELITQLHVFSYLLQFAVQGIVYPVAVFGYSDKNVEEVAGKAPYHPVINIYYEPIEASVDQKSKLPYELLFTFQDLAANHIRTWFDSFEKYKMMIDLYRTLFYRSRLFMENRFLNIAQALESLHSVLFGSQLLPDKEFADRKKRVLKAIPKDLRKWAKPIFSNANFKSFKSRISELLNNKSDHFEGLIDDIDQFSKQVRDTRNEFVHQSKKRGTFKRGKEMDNAINYLTMLFELYLLEIIGFSDEKIHELIEAKRQTLLTGYQHLRKMGK